MIRPPASQRVLSLVPTIRGFGFAVLEQRGFLVAFGFARTRSNDVETFLGRIDALAQKHRARTICVEDVADIASQRRVHRLIRAATGYALVRRIAVIPVGAQLLRAGLHLKAVTKPAIGSRVAQLYPDLEEFVPPKRRLWEAERDATWMIRAVAIAICAIRGHE